MKFTAKRRRSRRQVEEDKKLEKTQKTRLDQTIQELIDAKKKV